MRMHSDGSFDDEELVREGGVFVSSEGGREVGPDDKDRVPGDYAEEPDADDGVPGTRDDLPYDFGVETAEAVDHLVNGPDHVNAGVRDAEAEGAEEPLPDFPEGESATGAS